MCNAARQKLKNLPQGEIVENDQLREQQDPPNGVLKGNQLSKTSPNNIRDGQKSSSEEASNKSAPKARRNAANVSNRVGGTRTKSLKCIKVTNLLTGRMIQIACTDQRVKESGPETVEVHNESTVKLKDRPVNEDAALQPFNCPERVPSEMDSSCFLKMEMLLQASSEEPPQLESHESSNSATAWNCFLAPTPNLCKMQKKEGLPCDLIISVGDSEGGGVKVHRTVFAAASEKIARLDADLIEIQSADLEDVQRVVQFVYSGEVSRIDSIALRDVYRASCVAGILGVKSCVEYCIHKRPDVVCCDGV